MSGSDTRDPREAAPHAPAGSDHPVSALQDAQLSGVMRQPSNFFTVPFTMTYLGPLDRGRLTHALASVIARHEILRTTFHEISGEWRQVVHEPFVPDVDYIDLRGLPSSKRGATTDGTVAELIDCPFDVAALPLLRASLVRVADDRHVLVLAIQHLVFDGPSYRLLGRELEVVYQTDDARDRVTALPPMEAQFVDYVAHQQRLLNGPHALESARYWSHQLRAVPTEPLLTTDMPRVAGAAYTMSKHPVRWDGALRDRLARIGSTARANLFMTVFAAYAALLHHYSGSTDIAAYTIFGDRKRPEFRPLIGMLMNEIVLRVDLSGDRTFADLLAQVRQVTLDAYRHQFLPLAAVQRLTAATAPPASLYRVKFLLHDSAPHPRLIGLDSAAYPPARRPKPYIAHDELWGEDLRLVLFDDRSKLTGHLGYNERLFGATTITGMAADLHRILDRVATDPATRLAALTD